jgi:hypothetical protein
LSLDACGLFLSSLGAWCLRLVACNLRLWLLVACSLSLEASLKFRLDALRVKFC